MAVVEKAVEDTSGAAGEMWLELIDVPENVRALDPEHVESLAKSIELLGQVTPVVLRPADDGRFVLVAGFHRVAAVKALGRSKIAFTLRDEATEVTDRAVENIHRAQLRPDEEAYAVRAMVEKGLSLDGAALALGWPKQRVNNRVKLLDLPPAALELIGRGVIPLSGVDNLLKMHAAVPELAEAIIGYIAGDRGGTWVAGSLAREPRRVIDTVLRSVQIKAFVAILWQVTDRDIVSLKLGKKADALLAEAFELTKKLDRYSYGLRLSFSEEDVDKARAAGVLLEFETGAPIIIDRPLYRELVKDVLKRSVQELKARLEQQATDRKKDKTTSAGKPADPMRDARLTESRKIRQIAIDAHGANLDLGRSLITELSTVDPADMTVARFFVYALLGSDDDGSVYSQSGMRVRELAISGVRLVVGDFRKDVTKTKKDGSRGALKIDYGKPSDSKDTVAKDAVAWLWKFIDGAKTAGELYGRALVIICAEKYASRLVVPSTQQHRPTTWSSHKSQAEKALAKLADGHLPASLAAVEKAVAKAGRERQGEETKIRKAQERERAERAAAAEPGDDDAAGVDLSADVRAELEGDDENLGGSGVDFDEDYEVEVDGSDGSYGYDEADGEFGDDE